MLKSWQTKWLYSLRTDLTPKSVDLDFTARLYCGYIFAHFIYLYTKRRRGSAHVMRPEVYISTHKCTALPDALSHSLSIAILNSVVYIYQRKITALMHLYAPGRAHTHTRILQLGLICSSIFFPTFFQDRIDCDITHTGCRSIVPACSFIGWVGAVRLQAAILNHQSPPQIRAFTSKRH